MRIAYKICKWREKIYCVFSTIITKLKLNFWGVSIGADFKSYGIPYLKLHPGSRLIIGENCRLRNGHTDNSRGLNHPCIFIIGKNDATIEIGNNVGLSGVSILCNKSVIIDDDCLIGANVIMGDTDNHSEKYGLVDKPVHIKRGTWIGMNSVILKGVEIGENVIIGACSVVTKNIPDNVIAAGNPCRIIKQR